MFHKVLVPLDGTSGSEKAVPYAQRLARALATEVAVCHVITTPAGQRSERQQRDAERYLTKMAHQFRLAEIPVEKILRKGEAPLEIQKAAQEWGADAIVMATRSRRRLEKLVLGSVADVIVRDSRLPVLLVSQRRPSLARRAA
jgi:nucleotide-binding universal stress UspA family protein